MGQHERGGLAFPQRQMGITLSLRAGFGALSFFLLSSPRCLFSFLFFSFSFLSLIASLPADPSSPESGSSASSSSPCCSPAASSNLPIITSSINLLT